MSFVKMLSPQSVNEHSKEDGVKESPQQASPRCLVCGGKDTAQKGRVEGVGRIDGSRKDEILHMEVKGVEVDKRERQAVTIKG